MLSRVKNRIRATGLYRPVRRTWRLMRLIPLKRWNRRRKIRNLYRGLIPRNSLCFDIGANIGIRTQLLREVGASVVAVEPQSACVSFLQSRFRKEHEVRIEAVAVGEHAGHSELMTVPGISTIATLSDDWSTASQFKELFGKSVAEQVTVVTLDSLIKKYGVPHFCKIDVEGFELEVLNGLTVPIQLLALEHNGLFTDKTERCVLRLSGIGNYLFNFSNAETSKFRFKSWVNGKTLVEFLMKQQSKDFWGDIYALHQ